MCLYIIAVSFIKTYKISSHLNIHENLGFGIRDSEFGDNSSITQVRICKIFDPILVGLPGKKTASDICLTLTFKLFRTHVLVYHYALKGTPLIMQF